MRHILKRSAGALAAAVVLAAGLGAPKVAQAQEGFCLGQVMLFGGTYCPRGWSEAAGQLLAISSNQALYSIFGTMYGGDGRTTFGLPDLRARVPIHTGHGAGLANYTQGQKGGTTSFTLTQGTMPQHNHAMDASSSSGTSRNPGGNVLASGNAAFFNGTPSSRPAMDSRMLNNTGSGISVLKIAPYQVVRYCVATQGVFCSRS